MWCSTLGCLVTLILSLLAAPLAAEAQPAAKVPRVGVLSNNSLASASWHDLEPFRQGLRDLGYVEGQNIVVEYRFAEWQEDRLPAIYAEPELVKAGGLMSYGPHYREMARRAPVYVDKILKGATPASLPVEQAMRFDFVINL
jgi:hypothetical protein